MDLNPAWSAGHILAVVLRSPALHKAQAYRTHLGELKRGLVSLRDGLGEQVSKVLIVEDTQAAARRNLTHGGRVKAVILITVTTLDKNARVAQALCIHLTTHVVQMQACNVQQTTSKQLTN